MSEDPPVRVRPATEADLLAMEWEGEYRHFRRVYRQALEEARQGRRLVLLAEVEGRIVGQVLVQLGSAPSGPTGAPPAGYLHALRVRSDRRNQGVGTLLLETAEQELKRRGHTRVRVASAKGNRGARRLYERRGYRVVGEDPGEWAYLDDRGRLRQIAEPAFLLEKDL